VLSVIVHQVDLGRPQTTSPLGLPRSAAARRTHPLPPRGLNAVTPAGLPSHSEFHTPLNDNMDLDRASSPVGEQHENPLVDDRDVSLINMLSTSLTNT
jgi:hypothetical protein